MSVAAIKQIVRRGLGLAAPMAWALRPTPSLVVLTYHRVLPKDHPDRLVEQPGMCVAPETLEMHLGILRRYFEFVDLADWVRRSNALQSLPPRACAITLDDGWRDNFDYAFPVLVRHRVPATIFLVSDFIGSSYQFWPNRLAELLYRLADRSSAWPSELVSLFRRVGLDPAAVDREEATSFVGRAIAACKSLTDAEVVQVLDEVERGGSQENRGRSLLSREEVAELSDSGLIAFGSHSRRHTRLIERLPPAVMEDETKESRRLLEQLTKRPVDLFCYPNGDYCNRAVSAVRGTYLAAVTTVAGWNYPTTDRHLMPRISLHDDISGDQKSFLARIGGLV